MGRGVRHAFPTFATKVLRGSGRSVETGILMPRAGAGISAIRHQWLRAQVSSWASFAGVGELGVWVSNR